MAVESVEIEPSVSPLTITFSRNNDLAVRRPHQLRTIANHYHLIIWSKRHLQKRDQKTPQIVCNIAFYQYPLKDVYHIFYTFSKPSSPETESDTPDPAIRVRKPLFGLFKT